MDPPTTTTSSDPPPSNLTDLTPHYTFPPFFTLQPNLTTRASQLSSWSTLIQSYARSSHLFSLSLLDALDSPLFHNKALGRRLSARDARVVVDWMASSEGGGRAEWKNRFYIFYRRPEEWAEVVEAWVERTGQKGTVLTLYELTESDAVSGEEFCGMPGELLGRCLGVLVKRGRAQVFGEGGGEGVKFLR
ncbi:ESCRT-II complex, vps25 subunit [Aulographum hederae CBS 113979]|uniref:Vacuolar protein-sorting-associated protein 25 n=1 Tax=Aulographum hederae CBS 113979 TaxID=1176131 RepID=A0A6G1H7R2_9PEZI|nr:ESCRT-II complex, vps25 subunit [Aulographum hederae CBS 113979]